MGYAPVPNKDILAALQAFNREPFREILSSALSCDPTPKAIQQFANKSPDRYAQFIMIFAKLAGYSDKLEVDVKGLFAIAQLSDAELMDRRNAMLAEAQTTDDRGNNGGNTILPNDDKVMTSTG